MTIPLCPAWRDYETKVMKDGFYNLANPATPFPGYIAEADKHPFLFNFSLSFENDNDLLEGKFSCTDTQERFLKNLQEKGQKWRYASKEVRYKVNSDGYRTKEWADISWKDSIVLIGCSCTYGVGLDESETISALLEQYVGRPVVNLGFPGGSNDVILNNATSLYNRFGAPYAVIILWTVPDRFRFYGKDGYYDAGAWTSKNFIFDKVNVEHMWRLRALNKYHEFSENYYISETAKALWKDRTKYITGSFFNWSSHIMRADTAFVIDNEARDLLHPGYRNSIEVATYIKKRLDEMK